MTNETNRDPGDAWPWSDMPDVQIPTCLSGTITALPPISSCMDGATHQLHTITPNPVRLKATTEEAKIALDEFSDSKAVVSVCGSWVGGPECSHLGVYHVSLLEPSAKQFKVIALTSLLPAYQGCSVVPANAFIPMIYSAVFGPAPNADCRQWIADNCGR